MSKSKSKILLVEMEERNSGTVTKELFNIDSVNFENGYVDMMDNSYRHIIREQYNVLEYDLKDLIVDYNVFKIGHSILGDEVLDKMFRIIIIIDGRIIGRILNSGRMENVEYFSEDKILDILIHGEYRQCNLISNPLYIYKDTDITKGKLTTPIQIYKNICLAPICIKNKKECGNCTQLMNINRFTNYIHVINSDININNIKNRYNEYIIVVDGELTKEQMCLLDELGVYIKTVYVKSINWEWELGEFSNIELQVIDELTDIIDSDSLKEIREYEDEPYIQ